MLITVSRLELAGGFECQGPAAFTIPPSLLLRADQVIE